MPKILYKTMKFSTAKMSIVSAANRIIDSYLDQGYRLTLRQLYYRFVADDLFPDEWADAFAGGTKNTQKNYDKLGTIISDARMAGYIDWEAIEDRTRQLEAVSHWNDPADIIATCERSFRLDKWNDQPCRIEVWVEKDALEGIVMKAAHALDVAAFSCRGYTSMSSMWEASQRLKKYVEAGQRPIILHLGDHDPSGIDMTRDIEDRLNNFLVYDWLREQMQCGPASTEGKFSDSLAEIRDDIQRQCGARGILIRRIALNRNQVDQYQPPPNPAKVTDSRYQKYADEHGEESWELDALEPAVLDALITNTILEYRDESKWKRREKSEKVHRDDLGRAAKHWSEKVTPLLRKLKAK
jgi:hypothetical protein